MVRGLRAAALFALPNGLNITSDLIQVRKVVAGQQQPQEPEQFLPDEQSQEIWPPVLPSEPS